MGVSLLVYTEKRRIRVPLHDNFFAEPLAALFTAAGGGASKALAGGLAAACRSFGRSFLQYRTFEFVDSSSSLPVVLAFLCAALSK